MADGILPKFPAVPQGPVSCRKCRSIGCPEIPDNKETAIYILFSRSEPSAFPRPAAYVRNTSLVCGKQLHPP